jgi:hypothetical protein
VTATPPTFALSGYFPMGTGEGVMSSIGLFDTSTQATESTRVASEWARDEKLERILRVRRR